MVFMAFFMAFARDAPTTHPPTPPTQRQPPPRNLKERDLTNGVERLGWVLSCGVNVPSRLEFLSLEQFRVLSETTADIFLGEGMADASAEELHPQLTCKDQSRILGATWSEQHPIFGTGVDQNIATLERTNPKDSAKCLAPQAPEF